MIIEVLFFILVILFIFVALTFFPPVWHLYKKIRDKVKRGANSI
jgi:hypothetical protein